MMKRSIKILVSFLGLSFAVACRPGPVDPHYEHSGLSRTLSLAELQIPEESHPHQVSGVTQMWQHSTGVDAKGSPVVIALIGSGIDYTNPDLRDVIWTNPGEISSDHRSNGWDDDGNGYEDDIMGYDFHDGDGRPYDWHGHDTYIASLIASSGRSGTGVIGIAPNARLMPLRTISSDGRSSALNTYWAIQYAIDEGAKIIYLNWPKGGFGSDSELIQSAVRRAKEENVLVVLPAGNDSNQAVGDFIGNTELVRMDHVLVVSALDADGKLTAATNYGRQLSSLGAVSVNTLGYLPGGRVQTEGLSNSAVAAAQVVGAAALLAALPGYGRVEDIRATLLAQTDKDRRMEVLSQGRLSFFKIAEGLKD